MATIAAQFGLASRTVERWAKNDPEGEWFTLRQAKKVVSINQPAKPKPHPVNNPNPTPAREPVRVRRRDRGEIDELELVDIALCDVSAVMGGGEIDAKGIGSCATALCRLVELRLKLKPRSVAELAELAIGLGVSPAEFARELRQAWEKRA